MALLVSCFCSILLLFANIIIGSSVANATLPVVALDYGTFQGASSSTYNLTYFRKIPFAASTAGRNRFRAPQPPVPINGTYNTDQSFDMCPQRTVNGSEDCLYLGLYSRPWRSTQSSRPVVLAFYGGGFIQGSASFTIPPPAYPILNVSEANDFVVVYSNYRTNVFGLLPGKKILEHPDTDLNPGLLDQQAALLWIQKYIHHFGGNKSNVTIWGQSAGGGSVVAQNIATGNNGQGLFKKAMASSPYWPKTYRYDSVEAENLFDRVVQGVGCKGQSDEVTCLKNADVQKLRYVSLTLSSSHIYNTSSYTWAPVIDDSFLASPLTEVISKGNLNAEFVMSSYNLHEGENFIPPGLQDSLGSGGFNSSEASFDAYLKGFLPDLSEKKLQIVKNMYQAGAASASDVYTRAGQIYRDLVLACPGYWMSKKEDGWMIKYVIIPAKHASDTIYWNQINAVQTSDPLTYRAYAGAMGSFIQTGDPDAHKVTNASILGVPAVNGVQEFVVKTGGPGVDAIDVLEKKCAFWLREGPSIPI